jgi:NAD(P)H-dependent FMN reductase
MPNLMIIVGSTRPGRVGLPMAEWIRDLTVRHGGFQSLDFADLAEIDLPFMNEPHHPRLQRYTHQHTRDWSDRVARADAFVLVTPEYNYGMPAPLKNAIDYLHHEWAYKPVAFVSYGGVAAGTRAVQMTKQVVTTLRMFALFEAVYVPFVHQFIGPDGQVQPNEVMEKAGVAMLDELVRVAEALRPLRAER